MSAATETELHIRAVVLSDLRRIEDTAHETGMRGAAKIDADAALSRFLRALGHGAVADQWERVR